MGGERDIGDVLAEIKVRAERVGMRASASLFYSGKRSFEIVSRFNFDRRRVTRDREPGRQVLPSLLNECLLISRVRADIQKGPGRTARFGATRRTPS
jgi:hypothetical protein